MKKSVIALAAAGMLSTFAPQAAQAVDIKIGFLPGVVDPFYQVMQKGVEAAAKDFGVEIVTQIPPTWGVEAQTPLLDALVARGDLDYIITAAVDSQQMIAPLQAASEAGVKIVGVDTFLGDGDYAEGPVTFPMTYIGSDNEAGGAFAAQGLAKAIGNKGKVYINSVTPNIASVELRVKGFKEEMAKHPDIIVIGPDYNDDDLNKATQQTAAVIEQNPDLAGVFGSNVFSAQGAGNAVVNAGLGGHVQVVAYDATKDAIEMMRLGQVSMALAQKPFDMGYLAVAFAVADHAGVTSLPKRLKTGFAIIDATNVDDPNFSKFIYQ
ncbi:MAG TPA: ABC transporter substrate-binding protein [Devosia sp.]|nr:ABC transporter substrate-binding protein [Devosia sp.]